MKGLNFAYACTLIERAIGMPIVMCELEDGSGFSFNYRIGEPCYAANATDYIRFDALPEGGYKVSGCLATQLRCSKEASNKVQLSIKKQWHDLVGHKQQ